MNFLYYTTFTLLVLVAVLLILLILIQKGRGGGLSSAFGGGGGGSAAFGPKTGDVLTWATSCFFGVFILLAVALDLIVNSQNPTAQASNNDIKPIAVQTTGNQAPPVQTTVTPPAAPGSNQPRAAVPTTGTTTAPAAAVATPAAPFSPSVFQNPLNPTVSPNSPTLTDTVPLILPTSNPSSLTGLPLGTGTTPATPGIGITPGGLLNNPGSTPGSSGLQLPIPGVPSTNAPPAPTLLPAEDKDPLTGLPRTPVKLPGSDTTLTVPTLTPGDTSRLLGPTPTTKP